MPEVPELPEMGNEDIPSDPMMGDAPDMGNQEIPEVPEAPEMDNEEGGDSTMDIINQLSDEDRESVRAYAESMLDRSDKDDTEQMNGEEIPEVPMQQECKRFTKKQLKEEFGVKPEPEIEDNDVNKKRDKVGNGNPFNPPKFN